MQATLSRAMMMLVFCPKCALLYAVASVKGGGIHNVHNNNISASALMCKTSNSVLQPLNVNYLTRSRIS